MCNSAEKSKYWDLFEAVMQDYTGTESLGSESRAGSPEGIGTGERFSRLSRLGLRGANFSPTLPGGFLDAGSGR